MIVVPFVLLFLSMTIFGLYFALIGAFYYATLLLVGKLFGGIVAGAVLSYWIQKEVRVTWYWAALGVIALEVVKVIPIIGWFICIVFTLTALGAIVTELYLRVWRKRK
jgi:hypothetical protein